MAMTLRPSRLRLTQAIYFGKSYAVSGAGTVTSVGGGNGIAASPSPIVGAGTLALGPLTGNWAAGAYDVNALNSVDVNNVKAHGALGNAVALADGAMAAGSDHLTSASNPFVAGDVGKLVTVRGAGAAGATLVTHINSFVGAGEIVLHDANASGGPVAAAVVLFGTDDSAAFTAALTAVNSATNAGGGIVFVPGGRFMLGSYTLDFTGKNGITLAGVGNATAGGSVGTQLIFTNAAATCIELSNTNGNAVWNLSVLPENSAFTGTVIDATSADLITIQGNTFDLAGAGLCTAIKATDSIYLNVTQNSFTWGAIYVDGAGYACNIVGNAFGQTAGGSTPNPGPSVAAIRNPGEITLIEGNAFEPGRLGQGNAVLCVTDCRGLNIDSNWFGDTFYTAVAHAYLTLRGSAINITGNFLGAPFPVGPEKLTGIKFTNICYGVSINGNDIDFQALADCVGIDGGSSAMVGVDLTGNNVVAATTITGFTAANYVSQGTSSNLRFGIGNPSPDSAAYGAGEAVIEARARSTYGVFEATGGAADADNSLTGEYVVVAPNNSGGSGEKRITAVVGYTEGTTANQRGGKLLFYTKQNAGALTVAGAISKDQYWGINTTAPTRPLDLNGTQRFRGIAAPAVSEANSGTIYFDAALNKYRVSMNGAAYVDLVGSAGLTGSGTATKIGYWSATTSLAGAANIYADATNHRLGVKVATPAYTLDVDGDLNLTTGSVFRVNALPVLTTNAATDVTTVGGDHGAALGNASTAVGRSALNAGTGINNTAVGNDALLLTTTGEKNTAVGQDAGDANTTGSNNVFLGAEADAAAGNLSNAVAIGYQASVAASDSMSLGNSSMKVGIHTSTPATALDVNGAVATRHLDIVLVNGANADIALTDSSWIRFTGPTGGFSISGFTNGTDGRHLTVYNTTTEVMTITNLAGSAAANQIDTLTGADVVLGARKSSATFIYEDTADKWILVSYNG